MPSIVVPSFSYPRRVISWALTRAIGKRRRRALGAAWFAAQAGHRVRDWLLAYRAELYWSGGDASGAERLWRQLSAAAPKVAFWPLQLAMAARVRGDRTEQERILLAARARGIDDAVVDRWLSQFRRLAYRGTKQDAEAAELVSNSSTPAATLLWACVHLSSLGRKQEARVGLHRLKADQRLGWEARIQLSSLDLIDRDGVTDFIPGWFSPSRSSSLIRTGSDTLLVAFLQPGGAFGVSGNAILALLGPQPPNVLYLYDSKSLFHLDGTDRFGSGYQAMLDGIRGCAAEIGAKRLMTFARCAPGYTAIRAGLDLKAARVIAISPVTTIMPHDMREDGRMPVLQRRLAELVTVHNPDLQADVSSQTTTEVHIFYNRANDRDRRYAERFLSAPLATLYALEGSEREDPLEGILCGPERATLQTLLK